MSDYDIGYETGWEDGTYNAEGEKEALLRVVRAAENYRILYGKVGETNALIDLWEALEALLEHLRGE